MTTFYADTSALVKKYINESGSRLVAELLSHAEYVVTSVFTELELTHAIEFAKHGRRIDSPAYRQAASTAARDFQQGWLTLLAMSVEIRHVAKRLIRQRRLRAPDAIQLATAMAAARQFDRELQFLCADHQLLGAARLEGLRCRDVSR